MDSSITTRSVISSDKVEGTSVYNPAGDKLGSIDDLMIDKHSGHVHGSIAAPRPRLKNCWSMQSNSHASEATLNTNQCSRLKLRHQAGEGVDMKGWGVGRTARPARTGRSYIR